MKRIFSLLLVVVMLVSCADSSSVPQGEKVKIDSIQTTSEEFAKQLESVSNITAAEDMQVVLPSAERLYEFYEHSPAKEMPETFEQKFKALFAQLFPKTRFDGKLMYYQATDGSIKQYSFDDKDSRQAYTAWYDDEKGSEPERAFLLVQPPGISSGLVNFNKGEFCRQYLAAAGLNERPRLELYTPDRNIGENGEYVPMLEGKKVSENDKIKLSDAELALSRAQENYENYISTLSIYKGKPFGVKVISAEAYRLPNRDFSCLKFELARCYEGVCFDRGSTVPSGYSPSLFQGTMIKSTEADSFYGSSLDMQITDKTEFDEVITLAQAAKIIGSELTTEVTFSAQKAELVYCAGVPEKYEWENDRHKVAPAWKLTLYNANDNYYYYCYVDAKDGGNFRYAAKEKAEK